ncbi:branched-chain amino acid ABC transporter permease [Desulfobulbus sp.]|uniref:branched-chain amino acid ABC transporter permease n=1 Tax=Desulfobulbus sp. TaxID=895 RepID=UPI00286F522E|nr:branched-chain amino acid ABC transporter permease [Desulfobulbus sp.]
MRIRKNLSLAGLCLATVGLHLLTVATGTQFYLTQLTMAAYYGLVVIGLGVLMGYAGQISIGHAGFFAIGGYLAAALTTRNLLPFQDAPPVRILDSLGLLASGQDIYGEALLTVTPWAACGLAVAAAALVALIIGVPVLKLKGHYLAMATLGFGTIVYRLLLASPYFGEADGIAEVPAFVLLPDLAGFGPVVVGGGADHRVLNFYVAWGTLILGMALLLNLIGSRVGRALRSLHSSEEAAEASGIATAGCKLQVFVLSAVYAAVAGVLLTHFNGGIGPSEASVMKSVRYVALVAVGGMTNLWGTLIMGVGLTFLSLRGVFGAHDDMVFGLILIAVMLFAPQGILSLRLKELTRRLVPGGRA